MHIKTIQAVTLIKGVESYSFIYNEANRAEALLTLGRFASNPELSFSWYDAAVLAKTMRERNARCQSRNRSRLPK